MSRKLIIKKLVDGQVHRLGELDFPEAGEPQLTVDATGPEADEVRAAWDAVRSQQVIRMQWTERDPKRPSRQLLKARDVHKGQADYPRAVADMLSRRYGLFTSPAELG